MIKNLVSFTSTLIYLPVCCTTLGKHQIKIYILYSFRKSTEVEKFKMITREAERKIKNEEQRLFVVQIDLRTVVNILQNIPIYRIYLLCFRLRFKLLLRNDAMKISEQSFCFQKSDKQIFDSASKGGKLACLSNIHNKRVPKSL